MEIIIVLICFIIMFVGIYYQAYNSKQDDIKSSASDIILDNPDITGKGLYKALFK